MSLQATAIETRSPSGQLLMLSINKRVLKGVRGADLIPFTKYPFPAQKESLIPSLLLVIPSPNSPVKNELMLIPSLLAQAPLTNLWSNFTNGFADIPYNTGCEFVRYFLFLKYNKSKTLLQSSS